jgi:formate dehydrogenase iron-sulfur subunit
MKTRNAILLDFTRCEGCEACVYACKEANGLPDKEETDLSSTTYTAVKEKDDMYYRRMCMHCEDPTCASVCPVSAFKKTDTGAVIHYNTEARMT